MAKVIVTGASGYIGGQTVLQLKDAGYQVIGIDVRPSPANIQQALSHVLQGDFASQGAIDFMFMHQPSAIIHCAGTSLVGPSVRDPELYYENNFVRTKRLLDAVVANKSPMRVIFSSSAAVYGDPIMCPCQEEDPPLPISPYGESKHMVELLLQSYQRAYGLDFIAFRYFNAAGADPTGRHGQEPGASHIVARILENIKYHQPFTLNGNTYPTADGTCVRDYVHVADIANAHILAIDSKVAPGIYNLGTSTGHSNLEVINVAQRITNTALVIEVGAQRDGDPAMLTASPVKFQSATNWQPMFTLDDIVSHAWNWYGL
jgi:UDP-glucose-4-epimerase GalE